MRKRIFAAIAALIPLLSALAAAAPDDAFFERGKEILSLISYREYDKALAKANFQSAVNAEDFALFIEENFYDLFYGSVQREVAVACPEADRWILYIPVLASDERYGEVFYLTSPDGSAFDGYGCADLSRMRAAADGNPAAVWNKPYLGGEFIIQSDDPRPRG